MSFEDWLAEVDAEFQRIGWGLESYVQATGPDCWRDAYNDGLTPADAVSEELSAAAN